MYIMQEQAQTGAAGCHIHHPPARRPCLWLAAVDEHTGMEPGNCMSMFSHRLKLGLVRVYIYGVCWELCGYMYMFFTKVEPTVYAPRWLMSMQVVSGIFAFLFSHPSSKLT